MVTEGYLVLDHGVHPIPTDAVQSPDPGQAWREDAELPMGRNTRF